MRRRKFVSLLTGAAIGWTFAAKAQQAEPQSVLVAADEVIEKPPPRANAMTIRLCRDDERDAILSIVNAAAEAYRGVIPADRWHEPYMPGDEFDRECSAGVVFWGYEDRGRLIGVMGLQDVREANLIRHAYVAPAKQRDGVGGKLLTHLLGMSTRPMLVGTWADATWAIRFYQRHGFALVSPQRKTALLKSYWIIPERQIETSVVLANPPDQG